MKIAVIGGGGREHAVIKALKKSATPTEIFALPGNGGMEGEAVCTGINAKDITAVVDFCVTGKIEFAVVTPDDPLVLGEVDALEEAGIPCFGPSKKAAILEGSKVYSKWLMKKYGIPTAEYEVFDKIENALEYVKTCKLPTVIKADGLALGKGVIIAETREQATDAVKSIMSDLVFGESGNNIVIEEFLTGPEITVLCFTDGTTIVPMVSSMDHKRAYDGDLGLNTGGMGVIAPSPFYTPDVEKYCMEKIFLPTVKAADAEGRKFKGCLYFGLMLTEDGAKVIEYNCRFGDPEAQAVLALLKSDLLTIMQAVRYEKLADTKVEFKSGASCCVVMASEGYPQHYEKGFEITVDDGVKSDILFAGVKKENGVLKTNGGRVLGVTATGDDLKTAIDNAYADVKKISFKNAFYRRDIGQRALKGRVN